MDFMVDMRLTPRTGPRESIVVTGSLTLQAVDGGNPICHRTFTVEQRQWREGRFDRQKLVLKDGENVIFSAVGDPRKAPINKKSTEEFVKFSIFVSLFVDCVENGGTLVCALEFKDAPPDTEKILLRLCQGAVH